VKLPFQLQNWRLVLDELSNRYRAEDSPAGWVKKVELVCLVLAGFLVLQLTVGTLWTVMAGAPSAVPPAEDLLRVQGLVTVDSFTSDDRAALLERPVFWQERRAPAKAEVAAAPTAKPKRPALESLQGVDLIGVFGPSSALGLIARVDGVVTRISPGQTVKGWKMVGFTEGRARFEQAGRSRVLALALTTPKNSVQTASNDSESPDDDMDFSTGQIGFGGSSVRPPRKR